MMRRARYSTRGSAGGLRHEDGTPNVLRRAWFQHRHAPRGLGRATLRRARRGVAAVEFAIVAPVFFILVMAAFEFGRINVLRHTADNAAYEGARRAMVPGATAAEAVGEAERILRIVGTRGAKVTVNPTALGPEVDQITVTVEVPMGQNGWITPRFSRNATLRATSTLRTERARD
jgi:Flp pilus assembly protein TadG